VGGPDPAFNPRLAAAIANAKRGALAKSSIESAIAQGQGKTTSGAALESVTIEAMLPFSVGAVIECQTDSKLRTIQDVRAIISRGGGSITPTGFLFERKGKAIFEKKDALSVDAVLDQAIEAGATDVDVEHDGSLVVETEPSELSAVTQRLSECLGLKVDSLNIIHDPKEDTMVVLEEKEMADLEHLVAQLEEDPAVLDVYVNAA
jgi:transcriptional/translational regulatory protein YebC/TACO1